MYVFVQHRLMVKGSGKRGTIDNGSSGECFAAGSLLFRLSQDSGSSEGAPNKEGKEKRWGGGDAEGAARVGRMFDAKGSPPETWDNVFSTLLGELAGKGHHTLLSKKKKSES